MQVPPRRGPTASFSISDMVPPTALHRALQYTALLSDPPAADTANPAGIHPFRVVLDTVAQEERRRRQEAEKQKQRAATQADDAPLQIEFSSSFFTQTVPALLRMLCDVHGESAGAALYREWICKPRSHCNTVVAAIADATYERYIRHWCDTPLHPGATQSRDLYDIHVQFMPATPSATLGPTSALASNGSSGATSALCACVVVRSRAALARVEAEHTRVESRLLSVAALGQTLTSSLELWQAVSYKDRAAAELALLKPLGLVRGGALALSDLEGEVDFRKTRRQRGTRQRKRGRTAAAAAASTAAKQDNSGGDDNSGAESEVGEDDIDGEDAPSAVPVVVLGSGQDRGMWQQPSSLLSAASARPKLSQPKRVGPVRQSSCGLLAVLYLSVSGVMYVGFPASSSATAAEEQKLRYPTKPQESMAAEEAEAVGVPTRVERPPFVLSLDSSTSFTRGLLGL